MKGGAAAVVFDDAGRVLVVKENYGRRRWSLPGGMVDTGETPEDAVVREVREETGADVSVDYLIGVYGLEDGFRLHVFGCSIVGGEPTLQATKELSAVEWHAPDEIPEPRSNAIHYALPDALAGARGVLRDGLPKVS